MMSWIWQLESVADNSEVVAARADVENPAHASQSDAESWIGEMWPVLAEQGVTQATLLHDGDFVYGPMLLSE